MTAVWTNSGSPERRGPGQLRRPTSSLIRLFSHREAQARSCDPPATSIDAVPSHQRVWWA